MGVFDYKVIDVDSTHIDGTIVADTAYQARELLRSRGLGVTEVKPHRETKQWWEKITQKSADNRQSVAFIRELATLLNAGIALHSALVTLERQHSRGFKAVIQEMADHVASGASLAETMNMQKDYFDPLSVSIVEVGENTGELAPALDKLAQFREKTGKLRNRVVSAMLYPSIVCLIGLVVSIFLMTFVVPNLLETLIQSGKKLPAVTMAVKGLSDFLIGWWWLVLIAVVVCIGGIKAILSTSRGAMLFDRFVLRVPIVGDLIRKENTSRMAVMMTGLLSSGLQFVDALRITRRTIRNKVFSAALEDYETAVCAGSDIAGPLESSGVFSPMVVQMLSVGQHSGQLEQMLQQLGDTYDQEVEIATSRLTAILEPLLIVLLAIIVGFIAFATILPILEVSNVL